jgi:hypothetical protein
MKLKRVTINVDFDRRIQLYPEGGMDLECYVKGPGWVVDNDAEVSDSDLGDVLIQARNIIADKAAQFVIFEVAGSIGE